MDQIQRPRFQSPSSLTNQQPIDLKSVENCGGNINVIRILLKGDENTCLKLFKKAVSQNYFSLQIQLSKAFYGMRWGKDRSRDLTKISPKDLEDYLYCNRRYRLFTSVYNQAFNIKSESDPEVETERAISTFNAAAELGYLPARLELLLAKSQLNSQTYKFAVQLRPFVGQGCNELDFYFGMALKQDSAIRSPSYYEGIYWILRSGINFVRFPTKTQDFKKFCDSYMEKNSNYHFHDGFMHVEGSVDVQPCILASSKASWEKYKEKILKTTTVCPLEKYQFAYNKKQLVNLLYKYKIRCISLASKESEKNGQKKGSSSDCFFISTLKLYSDGELIGTISVRHDNTKLYKSFKHRELQPLIDFIENVMVRSGSSYSAISWLKQFGAFFP